MLGLILVYALTAVGSLAALRYPAMGLYVYVGFAVLRPQFLWGWAGNISNVSFIVGVATLLGWLVHGLGSWHFGKARGIVIALLFYSVWLSLSVVQAVSVPVASTALVDLLKILLPFLVGVTFLKNERDARTVLWVIVAAQAYVALDLNRSYLAGNNVAHLQGYGGLDNNSLGIGLVATVGVAVGLLLSARTWRERGIALAAALVILHTVLLTFSRGAMLGLLALGATAALIMPKRPRYIAAVALGLAIVLRLTGPELAARFETTFAESENLDSSAESRLDLWRDCLTVATGQPFLGVGPRNWPVVAEDFGWPAGKEAHSVWMQSLAEVGFPGVLALLAFYIMTAAKLWALLRTRRRSGLTTQMTLAFGLILSIVGYTVSAQFVSVTGLEVPFYIVMAGVILLKLPRPDVASGVPVQSPGSSAAWGRPLPVRGQLTGRALRQRKPRETSYA